MLKVIIKRYYMRMLVLDHHGIEERPPGDRYWLNSAHRDPRGAWLLQQVLNGQIQVHADGAQRTLRAGDCFLLRFGSKARYGWPTPLPQRVRVRWVLLRGTGIDAIIQAIPRFFRPDHQAISTWFDNLIQQADRNQATSEIDAACAVYGSLIRLPTISGIRHTDAPATNESRAVSDALRRIIAHPLHHWNLAQLAHECGCTRDHLCRVFKQRHQQTPQKWLLEQRLAAAEDLLRHSHHSLADIATQCGFGSTQSLARLIRQTHGCGPREWRKK